ncbi:MAG: ATP-binding protein [Chloroflexota bacterium]|jgi:signal transduction histidine kinase|nr:ATP-binding protein [Chloroflexota bacterium]
MSTSTQSDLPGLTAYRALARSLPDTAVLMFDDSLRFLLAEGRDLPAFGFNTARIVGYTLGEALNSDLARRYESHFQAALHGQQTTLEESFNDGRSVYSIQIGPARDTDQSVVAGVMVCRNISAQRTAERKLRESEARNRALITAMPDTILVINQDGLLVDYIPNQVIDIGAMMVPGMNIRDLPAPESLVRMVFDMIGRTLRDGTAPPADMAWPLPNGTTAYYELRCVALTDRQVMLLVRNITTLRRAEAALRARLDDLSALRVLEAQLSDSIDYDRVLDVGIEISRQLSGASAGFIAVQQGGDARLMRTFGREAASRFSVFEAMVQGICARVLRNQEAEFIPNVSADPDYVAAVPETVAQITIPLITHRGLIGLLSLESDRPNQFTETVFDVLCILAGRLAVALGNAQLHAQTVQQLEALRDLHERVSDLEQVKTIMLQLGAHDLGDPLMLINNFVAYLRDDLMQGKPAGEAQFEYLHQIEAAAERIHRISRDILDAERVDLLIDSERFEVLSLTALVDEVINAQRLAAESKGHTLSADLPQDPATIDGVGVVLAQSVTNLINNAIKYTPEGGAISVCVRPDGNGYEFSVTDTGLGIPDEAKDQLFKPLARIGSREARHIAGTGFGLYLVKRIVERHGGSVFFSSVYGQGSTFGFRLPRACTP